MNEHSVSSSEKLPAGTLCYVCQDLASGRHYGVPSCSGCKTFFRRAITNNRVFKCMGNGNCPVDKNARCSCRCCRLLKCVAVGMDKDAIQHGRDRIGYTKRTRRDKNGITGAGTNQKVIKCETESVNNSGDEEESIFNLPGTSQPINNGNSDPSSTNFHPISIDPMLERLTLLENNFSLLLSRAEISTYASLEEALLAPSIFAKPITVSMLDPIAMPKLDKHQRKMPFWRSRIITLYIDWCKTFSAFRKLPHTDKVALITNHASSFMIMCEAFRTPENVGPGLVDSTHYFGGISPTSGQLYSSPVGSNHAADYGDKIKTDHVDYSPNGLNDEQHEDNVHRIFDPSLISTGTTCNLTGVRSLVDVPPSAHYPSVGTLSGLAPVMSAMISYIMKPFRRLNITTTEFATLQTICFFDPDTEGLDSASQRNVVAEQKKFLAALYTHICKNYSPTEACERYSSIILRIPTIRKVAAKKNESLQIIDMFNLFSLNSLVKETALGIRQPSYNAQNSSSATANIKCEK